MDTGAGDAFACAPRTAWDAHKALTDAGGESCVLSERLSLTSDASMGEIHLRCDGRTVATYSADGAIRLFAPYPRTGQVVDAWEQVAKAIMPQGWEPRVGEDLYASIVYCNAYNASLYEPVTFHTTGDVAFGASWNRMTLYSLDEYVRDRLSQPPFDAEAAERAQRERDELAAENRARRRREEAERLAAREAEQVRIAPYVQYASLGINWDLTQSVIASMTALPGNFEITGLPIDLDASDGR